jgi:RNA polymerase sigma-70 factor (ECF subfamily)
MGEATTGASMPTATMTADLTSLLAADLDGNFVAMIRTHQDGIYSGVRRLAPRPADAEDITQETFARAYRALRGYESDRIRELELRAWLWTIALNLCRNAARARSRRPRTVPLGPAHDRATPDSVEDAALESFAEAAWRHRLASLPPRQRTAVVLRHVADLSYAEIAAAVDRPEGSVKSDVHRGLERLRRIIEIEETP